MKAYNRFILSASSLQLKKNRNRIVCSNLRQRNFLRRSRRIHTARYLDPKTSRWISADPAMYQGDYIPGAPINDEARKRNGNLPSQGGVYNYVNLHVYHYAGNNPVKYVDPDGNFNIIAIYSKSSKTLSIIVVGNNTSRSSATLNNSSASGSVRDRSQTGPVNGTTPVGKDSGQAKQYYVTQELPNGSHELGRSKRFNEGDSKYDSLGPAFVPILSTQDVPVFGSTEPTRNSDGVFEPTGTQTDGGYGIHADMAGFGTTWGCVGTTGDNKLESAIEFADWVDKAIDSGGSARLIIWD